MDQKNMISHLPITNNKGRVNNKSLDVLYEISVQFDHNNDQYAVTITNFEHVLSRVFNQTIKTGFEY